MEYLSFATKMLTKFIAEDIELKGTWENKQGNEGGKVVTRCFSSGAAERSVREDVYMK